MRLSRYGGDCYAYCMLAAGHIDLVIETELKPYDVLPLIPIIEGAGGIVTTWDDGRPHEGGKIIAAGDKRDARASGDGVPSACFRRCRETTRRRAGDEGVERRPELGADSDPAP